MDFADIIKKLSGTSSTGSTQGSGSSSSASSTYDEVSVFSEKSDVMPTSSTEMKDEEYFWWEKRLEEKKEAEEQGTEKSFDETKLDPKEWNSLEPKANNKFLSNEVKDYTFKTSSGTKIDLEDIEGVKIYENKSTGEVIIVGANGATINAGNKDAKITIYDSDIKKLDTDKGNDEIKIYNSNVGKLTTGRGIDNVVIENSTVDKINTGAGSDSVTASNSDVEVLKTASGEDTVNLNKTEANKVKTGGGSDNVIATDSSVDKLKSGGGSNSLNIENTEVEKLKTSKKDTVIEDSNYIDIDKTKIAELGADSVIDIGGGATATVSEYSQYLLSQPVGFETEEEYQEYVIQSLTSNLETMKSVFGTQEDKDGWVAGGYNGLKELTGLGISDKDVEEMIAKQEEMVAGLTAAINGESEMSFEEAYEYYTGTTYSKEKIDRYMDVANTYSAMMVGCQYDENYMEEFEKATGMSVEDVTKEYALCQLDTFGKSTGIQDLVEKYSQDQEGFADKLSAAISTVGITCIVVGAVVSFVFPPAAPVGAALMTAGKYVSLGGMFMDNAMDLVDDTTDKDGLTKEELGENALETGVEVVSYATGRAIGGLTNNINTTVSNLATQAGASNVTSYIAGQAAETSADMLLSLGADYAIAQGQSLITTGEFLDSDEYWSLDRFLGEGKNQLIGILTGLSSAKINNSSGQAAVYATAGKMVLDGDSAGARTYLETSGVKVDDTSFDDFQRTVIEANPEADVPKLEAPKENNAPEIEVDKPVEENSPRGFVFNPETGELTPIKPKSESSENTKTIELDHPESGDNIGVNLRGNSSLGSVDIVKTVDVTGETDTKTPIAEDGRSIDVGIDELRLKLPKLGNSKFKSLKHALLHAEVGTIRVEDNIQIEKIDANTYRVTDLSTPKENVSIGDMLDAIDGYKYSSFNGSEDSLGSPGIQALVLKAEETLKLVRLYYDTGEIGDKEVSVIYETIKRMQDFQFDGTDAEIFNSLNKYKSGLYQYINAILRGEDVPKLASGIAYQKSQTQMIAYAKKQIPLLSSFLKSFELPTETKLYRTDKYSIFSNLELKSGKYSGQKLSDLLESYANGEDVDLEDINSTIQGQIINQKSFLSTSILKSGAYDHNRQDRQIVWNFTTLGNTHGAYIDACSHNATYEYEVLVDKGAKIKIKKIEFVDGKFYIDADVSN